MRARVFVRRIAVDLQPVTTLRGKKKKKMVLKAATAAPAPPLGKDVVVDGAANGGGEITAQTLQQKIDDGTAEVSD